MADAPPGEGSCNDESVIVERSMSPQFLSNAYLVHDGQGGPAFFVDAGGPVGPLVEAVERSGAQPTHVLLTHHHFDHVSELGALLERWPDLQVLIEERERALLGDALGDLGANPAASVRTIQPGEPLRFGGIEVRPLHTPGHTAGMLSYLALGGPAGGDAAVFTGDTLFKGSVGGVRAPGHTSYGDLRDSIMDTLMELPAPTVVYPGHTDATTVGEEWERNPFIRIWRGVDAEGGGECTALGGPATLILLAPDYDGGKKAWVRWEDGSDDIVPGSRIEPVERA